MINTLMQIQSRFRAGKDEYNSFGGFNYRNVEKMLTELKPILAEYDCCITFSDTVKEFGGKCYVEATATLHTPNGDFSTTAFAREQDTKKGMDAAQITGSCSTYARKYALCGLLAVDDNSADPDSKQNFDMISSSQAKTLKALAESKGSDLADICMYFKVNRIEEMTVEDYGKCLNMLNKKKDVDHEATA